jgi:hypothetical protein
MCSMVRAVIFDNAQPGCLVIEGAFNVQTNVCLEKLLGENGPNRMDRPK